GSTSGTLPTTTTSTSAPPPTSTTLAAPAFVPVQTTSLSMRDKTSPPEPAARKLTFKSNTGKDAPGHRVVVPALGGAGDPTQHGGTLVVYDSAGSGEKTTVAHPASGWRVLGKSTAPKGFRFAGSDPNGPVSRVIVKADQVKVRAEKSSWTYTLNEPSQGRIAVQLQLGTSPAWCADGPPRRAAIRHRRPRTIA